MAVSGALKAPGTQEPLSFQLHRQLEGAGENAGDIAWAVHDQLFQEALDRRFFPVVHALFPWLCGNSMEYQNGQPLPGRAPATAQRDPSKPNFQTSGYSTKPLTEQAKGSNRTKSSVRVRVEHVFGAQTNDMGGTLVRTIGMVRARAKIRMKNLTYNMRRLVQLRRINPCPA